MTKSRFFSIVGAVVLCASVAAADASAQSRGGGRSGGRGPSGRGPSVGRVAPRSPSVGTFRGNTIRPGFSNRSLFFPRYTPFARYYRPFYYRPGISLGFYYGYPYAYGYPYGYYGYPYYSYPYYSGYGYYGGDPYYNGGYGYPYAGGGYPPYGGSVAAQPGAAGYGEVRIEDAPKDAQVYADGRLVGSVGDFDGPVRHLPLEAGPHEIEIRMTGMPPMSFDVEVRPGQTISLHANVR